MNDNIILIGMPGAGKSTAGVVAAKLAGFQFLDSDLLIGDPAGRGIFAQTDAAFA